MINTVTATECSEVALQAAAEIDRLLVSKNGQEQLKEIFTPCNTARNGDIDPDYFRWGLAQVLQQFHHVDTFTLLPLATHLFPSLFLD